MEGGRERQRERERHRQRQRPREIVEHDMEERTEREARKRYRLVSEDAGRHRVVNTGCPCEALSYVPAV